jgi:hypothetical protein
MRKRVTRQQLITPSLTPARYGSHSRRHWKSLRDTATSVPTDLIVHEVNNSVILQRSDDGYINTTALCKAAGKQWNEYFSNKSTKEYLAVVEAKTEFPFWS